MAETRVLPGDGRRRTPAARALVSGAERASGERARRRRHVTPLLVERADASPTGSSPSVSSPAVSSPTGSSPAVSRPAVSAPSASSKGAAPRTGTTKSGTAKPAAKGAVSKRDAPRNAELKGAVPKTAEPKNAESKGAESKRAEPKGAVPKRAGAKGAAANDAAPTSAVAPKSAAAKGAAAKGAAAKSASSKSASSKVAEAKGPRPAPKNVKPKPRARLIAAEDPDDLASIEGEADAPQRATPRSPVRRAAPKHPGEPRPARATPSSITPNPATLAPEVVKGDATPRRPAAARSTPRTARSFGATHEHVAATPLTAVTPITALRGHAQDDAGGEHDGGAREVATALAQQAGERLLEIFTSGSRVADIETKVVSVVEYLRRRITGAYDVDEFGFDPQFTDTVLISMLKPIYDHWFRVEVRGIENIPATGGALVVANHSGTVAMDAVMTAVAIQQEHPAKRHLRMLGADLVFDVPVLSTFARRAGATLANNADAERLLSGGHLVGVWPEGFKGVGKPFSERYKLQRFGRGGFVTAALRTGVPIVPCSIVGAEEIYPMIGNFASLARLLNLPYLPITPTFPLLGPLGLIPLPSKWLIEFSPPVSTQDHGTAAADDPMLVFDLTDQVRQTIQQTLYSLLVQRRSVFF